MEQRQREKGKGRRLSVTQNFEEDEHVENIEKDAVIEITSIADVLDISFDQKSDHFQR